MTENKKTDRMVKSAGQQSIAVDIYGWSWLTFPLGAQIMEIWSNASNGASNTISPKWPISPIIKMTASVRTQWQQANRLQNSCGPHERENACVPCETVGLVLRLSTLLFVLFAIDVIYIYRPAFFFLFYFCCYRQEFRFQSVWFSLFSQTRFL